MSAWVWVAVALVGGTGAVARFLIDGAVGRRAATAFPLGTFSINLSGAFVLGLLIGLTLSATALTIAGTATIGSYTTFSTWMLETDRLGEDGQLRLAAVNIVASIVIGVAAAALGQRIGGWL